MAGDDRDGDDHDPQLKSLRAVWLSMRDSDEDPPDRGLDALMAAARAQATSVRPSWWHRVLESLRRPPVLALATVVVLLGGVAVLTRHDDVLEKAEPIMSTHARDVGAPTGAAAGSSSAAGELPTEAKKDEARPVLSKEKTAVAPPVKNTVRPTTPPLHEFSHAAPHARHDEFATAPDADDQAATATVDAAGTRGPQQVLVDQLATQARSAATRGDCENAKVLATRIARQDPAYYREHVAHEPAIEGCITPAQPDAQLAH